jgi:hypothetical protein
MPFKDYTYPPDFHIFDTFIFLYFIHPSQTNYSARFEAYMVR